MRRDHPRVRGEESLSRKEHMADLGSPPRARGRAGFQVQPAPHHGITPACAGKSKDCETPLDCDWDHPRVRGEELSLASLVGSVMGSPPRARGRGDG